MAGLLRSKIFFAPEKGVGLAKKDSNGNSDAMNACIEGRSAQLLLISSLRINASLASRQYHFPAIEYTLRGPALGMVYNNVFEILHRLYHNSAQNSSARDKTNNLLLTELVDAISSRFRYDMQ